MEGKQFLCVELVKLWQGMCRTSAMAVSDKQNVHDINKLSFSGWRVSQEILIQNIKARSLGPLDFV